MLSQPQVGNIIDLRLIEYFWVSAWLETRAVLPGLRAGIAGIRAEMAGPDFLTESIIINHQQMAEAILRCRGALGIGIGWG